MADTDIRGICHILYAMHSIEAEKEAKTNAVRQQSVDAQHTAHLALVDSISTLKAFQARCGVPSTEVRGISAQDATDTDPALNKGAITLVYRQPPTEMHVIFTKDKDFPVLFREHLDGHLYTFAPYDGLVEMGCVKNDSDK